MAAWRHALFDMFFGNEANTTIPLRRRVVQDVIDGEAFRVLRGKLVKFLLQEDILMVNVGKDQAKLGAIRRVLESSTDDLKHGCNTSATSDHTKFTGKGRAIGELALGTLNTNIVTDLEKAEVARNVALLVALEN
jgi:hypothetical protein